MAQASVIGTNIPAAVVKHWESAMFKVENSKRTGKEIGIDQMLHSVITKVLMDATIPKGAVLVLATGDGNQQG